MLCFASFAAASRFPWLNAGRPQQRRFFTSDNFESERFQHFHRGNADVRFVIPHKGVVPKNDFAAVLSRRSVTAVARSVIARGGGVTDPLQHVCKPFVEAFTCVMGQRASCGDSNCLLHCDARRLETEKPIRQPRHETAEFA